MKDGINNYVVHGRRDAVNPDPRGTKAAAHYAITVPAGGAEILRLRLCHTAYVPLRPAAGARGLRLRLRGDRDGAPARGRRVLRVGHPGVARRRRRAT